MLKALALLLFIAGIVSFAYFVNEQTQDWADINTIIVRENIITNNETQETKSTLRLNLQDQSPKIEFVSATEYTKGDGNGSTIVKLVDWRGDKINTTCWEKILYPDKTTFTEWTTMTQHWEYGNYYMNFVVPEPLGIYDQEVRCLVGSKNISIGKGFHVSNISNIVTSKIDELKVDHMTVMS